MGNAGTFCLFVCFFVRSFAIPLMQPLDRNVKRPMGFGCSKGKDRCIFHDLISKITGPVWTVSGMLWKLGSIRFTIRSTSQLMAFLALIGA